MTRRLPTLALLLGLAGLIPFVACAWAALSGVDAARSARFVAALVAYGAVILSFLGGVHWGFVLATPAPEVALRLAARENYRLVLGVSPALVGWFALLLWVLGLEAPALAVLIAGFVAMIAAEADLRRRALMPAGYTALRWGLSIAVVLILATTLTLRLVHARIIF
jgi:hypothetical protein